MNNRHRDVYVNVATVDQVEPGGMLRVKAHDDCILLVNYEREFYAISDACSHEDASLYLGVLKDDTIRCPLHGSRFSIKTGIPMEEPAQEPISTYPIRMVGDQIFIGPKKN